MFTLNQKVIHIRTGKPVQIIGFDHDGGTLLQVLFLRPEDKEYCTYVQPSDLAA